MSDKMPEIIYLYESFPDCQSLCWTKDESKGQTAYRRVDKDTRIFTVQELEGMREQYNCHAIFALSQDEKDENLMLKGWNAAINKLLEKTNEG